MTGRGRDWGVLAPAILPVLLAATTLAAVLAAWQATPYQDQWGMVASYRDLLRHGPSLEWFWRQHNEHRIVFPRLVFLADMAWTRGSNLVNLTTILAIQALGAWLFVRLALRGDLRPLTAAAAALAAACLFSLAQWENLVWGFQVQFVGVYCAGGWGLFLFSRAMREPAAVDWRAWAGAMALLGVCTFSMANGVLVGGAMLLVALAVRGSWRLLGATLVVVAALAALYFSGFRPVEGHSSPLASIRRPLELAQYVAAYLGALFGMGRPILALGCGLVGIGLTAAMALQVVLRRERDPAQLAAFGIVLFVGLSAGVTALGRLDFGYAQAISSRYVTPSAWFWAAQFVFWGRFAAAGERRLVGACAGLAYGVAAFVLVLSQGLLFAAVKAWDARVSAASEALVIGLDDPAALAVLYPNLPELQDWSGFLRAQRLSVFAEPEAGWIGGSAEAVLKPAPASACLGAFDVLDAPAPGAAWRARGWAWDREARRTPRTVVLAAADGTLVGLGRFGEARPDVQQAVPQVWILGSGWNALARPDATGPLRAYAVLRDGRACPIGEKPAP